MGRVCDSMKKILLLSHEMTYTGAPRSLLLLAKGLSDKGYETDVWTLTDGGFKSEYKQQGYCINTVDGSWDKYIPELKEYDLLIANTVFCLHFAHFAQRYVKVMLILREAQNIHDIAQKCNINESLLGEIENIVCVSEYARDFIENYYGIHNIKILHNFISDCKYKKLNWVKKNKVQFIVSGTVEERKQQDVAIKAFRLMPDHIRNKSVLHIVGNKPDWASEYWKNMEGIREENIIFHGEIADETKRMRLYKSMNVFIVPSKDEACSLVALEAAMLGKAIILSDHVGAQYLLKNRKYIFAVGNEKELAWKMCQLMSRRELLCQGLMMKHHYYKYCSYSNYKAQLETVLSGYL